MDRTVESDAASRTTGAPSIAFIVLAHGQPGQAAELAASLVGSATDGQVWIHWDLNAASEVPAELLRLADDHDRVHLVANRVRCEWGKFGLVEAPINALREIRASGFLPHVAILLSGSCLPCRPVAELERFLAAHTSVDFIEDHDDSWMVDGWRAERWQYRHWFQHQKHPKLEHWSYRIQRALRIRRRFPRRLQPRFGSQWWALSWTTVSAILDDITADPKSFNFFKTVWIPDETVFQTYVHKLGRPAGFNLTHYQFTDRGKPVVYYDDHLDYLPTLDRFFARKVSPQAVRLRNSLTELAASPDTGRDIDGVGRPRSDYALTVRAQTWYPEAGHVYYRDQYADSPSGVLSRCSEPYVVLLGPTALTAKAAERLSDDAFTVLGEVFRESAVDLGDAVVSGVEQIPLRVRDLDPANFLVRLRRRCAGVPVIRWGLRDNPGLLQAVLRDQCALVVAAVPWPGDKAASETLTRLSAARENDLPVKFDAPGVERRRRERVWLDSAVWDVAERVGDCQHWLAGELFNEASDKSWIKAGLVVSGWGIGPRPPGVTGALADLFDRGDAVVARSEVFAASVAGNIYETVPWFRSIAHMASWIGDESKGGIRPFVPVLREAIELEIGASR